MSRLLLNLALLLALVLTGVSLIARSVGAARPPHPLMREFADSCSDQPQPCWNGIIPGETVSDAASDILSSKGYSIVAATRIEIIFTSPDDTCRKSLIIDGGTVRQINLTFCQPLRLGDFMQQPLQPDTVTLDPLSIWYQGHLQILFVPQVKSWDAVSYHTPLQSVTLFPSNSPMPDQRAAWLDVLTQRKYCQLRGLQYHCAG